MELCFLFVLVLVNEDKERSSLWLTVNTLDESSKLLGLIKYLCDYPLTKLLDEQHIGKECGYCLSTCALFSKQITKHIYFVMVGSPYDI